MCKVCHLADIVIKLISGLHFQIHKIINTYQLFIKQGLEKAKKILK